MNDPLISIIVPVYMVEPYLCKCLDSIINQTYKNLEIILVDDGSPDNCGYICDEYAQKDDRIIVIHKENGGVNIARNTGLDIAAGDYVTLIDSDDWVSEKLVESLFIDINKNGSDISMSGISNSDESTNRCMSSKEALMNIFYSKGVEGSVWGKLFRSEIIKRLRFAYYAIHEDLMFMIEAVRICKKVSVICEKVYFYNRRIDSITKTNFTLEKMEAIHAVKEAMNMIIYEYPELAKAVSCSQIHCLVPLYAGIPLFQHARERKLLKKSIANVRRDVLLDPGSPYKAKVIGLTTYCGAIAVKMSVWLYRFYWKARQERMFPRKARKGQV